MFEPNDAQDLTQVAGMAIHYEVHLQSDGRKPSSWAKGTWFQASGLIRDFNTREDAENALIDFRARANVTGTRYAYLKARIVQVMSVATVIQEVE